MWVVKGSEVENMFAGPHQLDMEPDLEVLDSSAMCMSNF